MPLLGRDYFSSRSVDATHTLQSMPNDVITTTSHSACFLLCSTYPPPPAITLRYSTQSRHTFPHAIHLSTFLSPSFVVTSVHNSCVFLQAADQTYFSGSISPLVSSLLRYAFLRDWSRCMRLCQLELTLSSFPSMSQLSQSSSLYEDKSTAVMSSTCVDLMSSEASQMWLILAITALYSGEFSLAAYAFEKVGHNRLAVGLRNIKNLPRFSLRKAGILLLLGKVGFSIVENTKETPKMSYESGLNAAPEISPTQDNFVLTTSSRRLENNEPTSLLLEIESTYTLDLYMKHEMLFSCFIFVKEDLIVVLLLLFLFVSTQKSFAKMD